MKNTADKDEENGLNSVYIWICVMIHIVLEIGMIIAIIAIMR